MKQNNNYAGIDYGRGLTNVDLKTGIRYGVISINTLDTDWIYDEFEPDYGDASCPKCGNTVAESIHGKDYFCDYCAENNLIPPFDDFPYEDLEPYCYYLEDCYSETPVSNILDTAEYFASLDEYNDIFITRSPYYTYAAFCSPCAPGAGHLEHPNPNGVKTYCFNVTYFEDSACPYPVYLVADDSLIYSPLEEN